VHFNKTNKSFLWN